MRVEQRLFGARPLAFNTFTSPAPRVALIASESRLTRSIVAFRASSPISKRSVDDEGGDQAVSWCQESVLRQEGDRSVGPVHDDDRRPRCDDLTKDTAPWSGAILGAPRSMNNTGTPVQIKGVSPQSRRVLGRILFSHKEPGNPSGRLSGGEERFEHLTHFRQLIMGLKAARVG